VTSKVEFYVKASIASRNIREVKRDAGVYLDRPSTGLLDLKIQADSVHTGSKHKDNKLKGKECLDVEQFRYITFQSSKIVQTGSHTFDVPGTFTVRGVSKPESLTFSVEREGPGTGEIEGGVMLTLVFHTFSRLS
jgi:polyisoprenoid-binding protein YceI